MKNSLSKENSVISCLVRILFKKPMCIHYKNSMTASVIIHLKLLFPKPMGVAHGILLH